MKTIILLLMFFAIVGTTFSQNLEGVVYELLHNKKSNPLPGVNIYWADTQMGVVTDADGRFILEKHPQSDVLVVSYIGYVNDTIKNVNFSKFYTIELDKNKQLDEVVVSERALGSQISKLNPIQTQSIGGSELKKAACCNLSESFETNASVDVVYSDAVSGAKQIQLLGLSGRYVQLMTENFPNYTGLAKDYGLTYIPGPWMQAISISKGPGSVVNGYDAISGQINIGYLAPAHNSDKLYVNIFANSGYALETNIYSNHKINDKWNSMILLHTANNNTKLDHNNDGFVEMPLINRYQAFNRWDYFHEGLFWHSGIKFLYENRSGGQLSFNPNLTRDTNNGYGIGIDTRRGEAFSKFGYMFDNNRNASLAMINNFVFHSQESFFGLNNYNATQSTAYLNLIFLSDIKNPNQTITAGIDFRYDDFDEDLYFPTEQFDFDRLETGVGAYSEFTWHYRGKMTLLAGIRSDYNNNYGYFFTPRLNVRYSITENLVARASAGKGYRLPNIIAENNSLLASSRRLVVQPDLNMEEAWSYGTSVSKYFVWDNKRTTITADFYRTDFVNQMIVDIDSDISTISIYNLTGESYSNNYQLEVNAVPFRGMELTLAYRYSDVKSTYGDVLMTRPLVGLYKGLVSASYQTPLKKWQFDLTSQLNGGGRIPSTQLNPEELQLPGKFDEYYIFNAQVTKYFRKWDFYLGVENIFDFVQANPILASDNPFGNNFDASLIWGPVDGRKIYAGLRYVLK